MCNILATGLMQPWYPSSASKTSLASLQPAGKKSEGKREKNVTKNVPKVTTTGFDADAISELKQALEVEQPIFFPNLLQDLCSLKYFMLNCSMLTTLCK